MKIVRHTPRGCRGIVAAAAVGALALTALTACGSSDADSGATGSKHVTIAYVPGVSKLAYFDTAARGAKAEAKKLGYSVDYVAVPAYDSAAQNTALNAALSNKPDFLLVSPVDDVAQRAAVSRYIAAGIPVITVGGTLADTKGLVSQILTDNYQGGQLVADYLGEELGGKGVVTSVNMAKGSATLEERVKGFEDRLRDKFPGITVLPEQYGGNSAPDTQKFMRSYLLAHRDLDAVFGVTESAAEGVSAAVKALGKTGEVKVTAFDASPEEVKALKAGRIDMLSVSKPGDQLALAVQQAHAYLTGDKSSIQAETKVGNVAVTRSNVDSPEIAPYLYKLGD